MKEVILIKMGEIVLKGLNRKKFEDCLIANIKRKIKKKGKFEIKPSQSVITISLAEGTKNENLNDIIKEIKSTFGIASFSKAAAVQKNIHEIECKACEYLKEKLLKASTFKVEAKRSDKKFHLKSPEICERVGGYILDKFKNLSVDVHEPDVTVFIEIRDFGAYIRTDAEKGIGGIPSGISGRAAVLISGGIDSPVAAWMMAKRGIALTGIYFESPPYTGQRAEMKVKDLLKVVSEYSGSIKLFTVPFTQIQEYIKRNCPEELFTIIMRRMMMRISQIISVNEQCSALITGESLGQVASQTINAIVCTESSCEIPIFRPLIGMDKEEIISIARKIGTFETSILPFEDCCTVFVPKHPRTKPRIDMVEKAEAITDWLQMINTAVKESKVTYISRDFC